MSVGHVHEQVRETALQTASSHSTALVSRVYEGKREEVFGSPCKRKIYFPSLLKMVRKKMMISRIENSNSRRVTFTKRRAGLFKKAHDLAVLCDAEVAVILFSSKGRVFQFAAPSMSRVLARYMDTCEAKADILQSGSKIENGNCISLTESIEGLEIWQSMCKGKGIDGLSLRDLIRLEREAGETLCKIRTRKGEIMVDQLEELKRKVAESGKGPVTNPNVLGTPCISVPSFVTDSRCIGSDAPQADAFSARRMDVSEHSNLVPASSSANKRHKVIEDLNEMPAFE